MRMFSFPGSAGPYLPVTSISTGATTTLTATSGWIFADTTANQVNLILPANPQNGFLIGIKKTAGTNKIAIGAGPSALIDGLQGSSLFFIRTINEGYQFLADGSQNWQIVPRSMNEVPVGAVIAFLVSFSSIPALPAGFVACNGQTLSDASSIFNGAVIPNLNASGGGTQRFLRGSTSSSTTGGSDSLTSAVSISTATITVCTSGAVSTALCAASAINNAFSGVPSFYEVQWIMRVK